MLALAQLLAALKVIGVGEIDRHRLILKVGLDSIPSLRRQVIAVLAETRAPMASDTLSDRVGYPTGTTRRALEDLAAHRVAKRTATGAGKAHLWHLTDWAYESYMSINEAFPKCQEGIGEA